MCRLEESTLIVNLRDNFNNKLIQKLERFNSTLSWNVLLYFLNLTLIWNVANQYL